MTQSQPEGGAENESPIALTGISAPVPAPARRFRSWITVLFTGLLVLFLGISYVDSRLHPFGSLNEPQEFLYRVMATELDADYILTRLPDRERRLWQWAGIGAGRAVDDSIEACRQMLRDRPSIEMGRTLAVLLGEKGDHKELVTWLDWVEDRDGHSPVARAIRHAYLDPTVETRALNESDLALLDLVRPSWAYDHLRLRIAERRGHTDLAADARQQLRERGEQIVHRYRWMLMAGSLPFGLGIFLIALWLLRGRPSLETGQGIRSGLWTLGDGFAVMIRGSFYGLLLAFVVGQLLGYSAWILCLLFAAAAIPLFWMGERHLLRPANLTLIDAFGLSVPGNGWPRLIGVALALFAVDLLLSQTIVWASDAVGFRIEWTESVPEEMVNGGWIGVLSMGFAAVVLAPLVEEGACRGFLYTSLRARWSVATSAVLSGLVFAALHLYSLPGMLAILGSGVVWALSYHLTRSLWPAILAHAAHNLLLTLFSVWMYRW